MAFDQGSIPKDLRPVNVDPAASGFLRQPHSLAELVSGAESGASATSRGGETGAGDDFPNEPQSGRKVKFLCSFGGKILPRPSDGALRYVGGQTRIISMRRDIGLDELLQKMVEIYGQAAAVKYQLPDQDIDALVSVSCVEDQQNMMEEYEKLAEGSPDGSAKLRVFLFSVAELDTPGLVQFVDFSDAGQRYVEAVNGIADGTGLRRKASVASSSSTQNSDGFLSGGDAGDSTGHGECSGGVSPVLFSPTGALSTGQGSGRSEYASPSSAVGGEPVTMPTNLPLIRTGPPSQGEFERPAPVPGQAAFPVPISHSSVVDYRQAPGYVHTYSDPHQEIFGNRADFPHNSSSQVGYINMNSQVLGPARPVYRQPELSQQLQSHRFMPVVHATVAPSSPPANVNPSGGGSQPLQQQFVQLHHPYMEESSTGARVVQVPADQGFKASPLQAQPIGLLQGQSMEQYNWRPSVASPDNIVCTEAWGPQAPPQGLYQLPTEKITRIEDCYLCQKALPHAHSDIPLQEHGSADIAKTVSDNIAVLQSCRSDESTSSRHSQGVPMAGAEVPLEVQSNPSLGVEVTSVGIQGSGIRPNYIGGQVDPGVHGVPMPHSAQYAYGQINEPQDNTERILMQPAEKTDYSRTLFPVSAVGVQGAGQAPYGMFLGNLPPSPQERLVHQPVVPSEYYHKADMLMNRTIGTDVHPVRTVPFLTSEPSVSPQDHILDPKDAGLSDVSHDSLTPVDGRLESLHLNPPEIPGVIDLYGLQMKPNFGATRAKNIESVLTGVESVIRVTGPFTVPCANVAREERPVNRGHNIAGNDVYITNNALMKPGAIPDGNYGHGKPVDPLLASLEGTTLHNFQPEEVTTLPQAMGNAGAYQHVRVGIEPSIPTETWQGQPTYSCTDSTNHTGERKEEASRINSRRIFNEMASTANVNIPFSASTGGANTGVVGDGRDLVSSNSLFSNQDPWKLRHDMHFPPPKVPKVPSREGLVSSGCSGEPSASTQAVERHINLQLECLSKGAGSETVQSAQGSSEEQIKQELQAIAEGVAASVLQSSMHPASALSGWENNDSFADANQDEEVQLNDEETQTTVAENIKNKFLGKANSSLLPIAEGISRLQIIKNSDLEELRELGSGTFGTVYHGKWRGTDVAIKRINDRCFAGKPSEQERMREDFWNEACKLADLHHPNVVAFYGIVLDGPGGCVATVTEYMVNGSLRTALQRNDRTLDYRKLLLIAMDVAFGMEYLHGKNIVHFDLKSDNLLVNLRDSHRPICKVGDLGLSKVKCQTLISGGVRGTLPWMAPELLNGSSSLVSEKVDVFSFGIVMWELLTGEEPYTDLHYGAIIGGIVSNTLRPPVPETCDPEWRSLMEKCWASEPSERPTFTEIADTLRSIAASLPAKGPIQLQLQTHR